MRPRVWGTTTTLSLLATAALLMATSPPAGAGLTLGPGGLLPSVGLPLPSLPPLPTPTLPTPTLPSLPTPTVPTGGLPGPTATRPAPTTPPPTVAPPGAGQPAPVPPPSVMAPLDGAAALIGDDPGASLYPQPPVQPPSTPAGEYAVQLAAVQQRIQYLHNVLARTSDDLAVAQRQAGAVPQLIDGLTAGASPAQVPAANTPAGRVAALAAAVASGQAELSRRDAEAASLQQLIDGQLVTTAATSTAAAPTRLQWPVQGTLTSRFGNRLDPYYHVWQLHPGIDLAAPIGTPIYAAAAGRVTQAGWYGGYGNYTCIAHGTIEGQSGVSTCYGHQSRIFVSPGQQVSAGQLIGLVGSTGASTGPHLHFEVRIDGRPVDPLPWLA